MKKRGNGSAEGTKVKGNESERKRKEMKVRRNDSEKEKVSWNESEKVKVRGNESERVKVRGNESERR